MEEEVKKSKSQTAYGKIYFWTASINNWIPILKDDTNKQIIINSLKKLSDDGLITMYAFVIMPEHIHLIWKLNKPNGKESPKSSFMKFTAHMFLRLQKEKNKLELFVVNDDNKRHEFWQKDSLAIVLYSRNVTKQKIDYIHRNPTKDKYKLSKDDISYFYSSALYYHSGIDNFGFLHNIFELFDGNNLILE